jgi:hypothetical protein
MGGWPGDWSTLPAHLHNLNQKIIVEINKDEFLRNKLFGEGVHFNIPFGIYCHYSTIGEIVNKYLLPNLKILQETKPPAFTNSQAVAT